MRRQWLVLWMVVLLVSGLFLSPIYVQAGRLAQDDPVAQCAEGVQLFLDGRATERGARCWRLALRGRDRGGVCRPR